MAEVEPNLPLFFNMHCTSHSGCLTSFSSLSDYNIFVEDKPDKVVDSRWHSKWCYILGRMDARVPRVWTLLSKAKRPKFTRSAQVKGQIALLQGVFQEPWDYKVLCEEGVLVYAGGIDRGSLFGGTSQGAFFYYEKETCSSLQEGPIITKTTAEASLPASTVNFSTVLGKRPVDLVAPSKPALAKRTKTLAQRPAKKRVVDLTEEPLPSASPSTPFGDLNIEETPRADTPTRIASSPKVQESDSTPKVTTGYSATYLDLPYTLPGSYEVTKNSKLGKALDAFRATHPLLLEEIGNPTKNTTIRLSSKAMNASHVLARRVDRLDVDLGLTRESERAS
ncbi:hypothetical protein LIER_33200 [Lithospermum erythrorhizon]|uniref:Uncharacterized protein n=1 Tax=Lithospermum erythrorhizon TaxID=34254 RepID=A0AAV3S029_LITER